MRLLRFLIIALPTLLGVAVAAAWVVPDMMDWDRYRVTIESLASSALGQPVRIEGRITLDLLPEPLLTAAEVHIGARSGAEVSARELRLGIAPASLLQGAIDARDLVLRDPVMRLPWPLPPSTFAFRRPPWLAALSAHIEGGTLEIGEVRFSGIDATLSAGDATGGSVGDSAGVALGGYRLAGTAQRDGDWRFTARLTGQGPDGVAGVNLTLDGIGTRQGLGVRFDGQLDSDGMLAGQLDAQGPDLSRLLPAPAVPFHASGRLTLASGLLAADELALDIGGSPARGAVALRLLPQPRLDLAVAASRLDLDAWLPALLQAPPAAYPVGVDLSAEAAQLLGGMLRRLRVAFDVAPISDADAAAQANSKIGSDVTNAVSVREASAILPGDATLQLAGTIRRGDSQHPAFAGTATLSAPAFRTTMRWLEAGVLKPLVVLPAGVLRSVDASGTIAANAGRISLTGLHGQADGAMLEGALGLTLGPRLAVSADVKTDQLSLDHWLPENWPTMAGLSTILPSFDVDVRVSAAHAAYRGLTIAPLLVDFAIDNNRLRLRHFECASEGVQAQLSGTIGEGGQISEGQLHASTKDGSILLPLLPAEGRIPALWRNNATLEVEAAGPPGALSVRAAAELGDLRVDTQATIDVPHATWAGPLTLRHPGAPRLLETLGLLGAPAWLGDGSFSLVTTIAAAPEQLKFDKLEVVAGSFRGSGHLLLDLPPGAPASLSGRISAETLPLPDIYMRGLEPLPLAWLRDVRSDLQVQADHVLVGLSPVLDKAQGKVSVTEQGIQLDGFKAEVAGGALTGEADFHLTVAPPTLHVRAALVGATIEDNLVLGPMALLSGQLGGAVAITASGHSPAALLATLAGKANVAVQDGAISGFNLGELTDGLQHGATDPALASALTEGSTGFRQLEADASIQDGRIVLGDAHLQGAYGAADFSGAIDIAGRALDVQVTVQPEFPDAPRPGVQFTGPFEAVRRIPKLTALAGWRAVLGANDTRPGDTKTGNVKP